MAVERNNPLPPNVAYWVDVAPSDQPAFTAWLNAYRQSVRVRSTNRRSDGWEWVLFEVTAPLVWWEGPGYPTIAPAGAVTETDVKQFPTVPSGSASLEETLGSLARTAVIAVSAIVLAAIVLNRVTR